MATPPPDVKSTVSAPVVVNTTAAEVQRLTDFASGLAQNPHAQIAATEGQRLMPYFDAMSAYLGGALDHRLEEDAAARALVEPASLCDLFKKVAGDTRNILLSTVAIVPGERDDDLKIEPFLAKNRKSYFREYNYNDESFSFGFWQILSQTADKSSVTFGVLKPSPRILKIIPASEARLLLHDLQKIFNPANHDMLHHFTIPTLIESVAEKFTARPTAKASPVPLELWKQAVGVEAHGTEFYEHWAQRTHEEVLQSGRDKAADAELAATVDNYFNRLEHIGKIMTRPYALFFPRDPGNAHKAVDYLGTLMLHALSRFLPLNHPLLLHAIDRLHQADPAPKLSEQSLFAVHKAMQTALLNEKQKQILTAYKAQGLTIMPDNAADFDHRCLKLFKLLQMAPNDLYPHAPVLAGDPMFRLRNTTPDLTLKMVEAIAATVDFKPPAA